MDSIYNTFVEKIDDYVAHVLKGYVPQHYSRSKVIHDCVWGSVMFYPWELQIMDSPLLQRLRRINQLGLAMYTYPSAHHSRFEHTLGVVAVASQMMQSINSGIGSDSNNLSISHEHICMIRMAALLHDIGHCFFSHLSESVYSDMEVFKEFRKSRDIFAKAQPHEIMGYVIINTPSFAEFFHKFVDYPYKSDTVVGTQKFLDNIGRMITGAYVNCDCMSGGIMPFYLTEMINGQFDADSLDYLRRDSYATGLDITYNLDRFLYKIRLAVKDEIYMGEKIQGIHLTVPVSGVSTVEEMMYNKQVLTRHIYQHQKVMAVDSLVWDIAGGLKASGKLLHPSDFLRLCDDNLFMLLSDNGDFSIAVAGEKIADDTDKTISDVVNKIKKRDLPKKALIINTKTIKSVCGKSDLSALDIADFFIPLKYTLREEIYAEAKRLSRISEIDVCFDMYDIHIAIPRVNMAKDYSSVNVISVDNMFVPISDIVNLNEIVNVFSGHSWKAYIFADSNILPLITIASKNVLEKHEVLLSDNAISQLKHSKETEKMEKIIWKNS